MYTRIWYKPMWSTMNRCTWKQRCAQESWLEFFMVQCFWKECILGDICQEKTEAHTMRQTLLYCINIIKKWGCYHERKCWMTFSCTSVFFKRFLKKHLQFNKAIVRTAPNGMQERPTATIFKHQAKIVALVKSSLAKMNILRRQ